jgi:hypothetical protein
MFGTLSPHGCDLSSEQKLEHRRFYCGLCKSLGDSFGQPMRATLTHDAVLLGLLVDALAEGGAAPSSCRCPILPVVMRPTVDPRSTAMRYAAAMQVLLGDQWLADREADGKRGARLARPLLGEKVAQARQLLRELGFESGALAGFEREQVAVERTAGVGVAEAAAPTARALATVFAGMAQLPGLVPVSPQILRALGEALGQAIYAQDALEDLPRDLRRGEFNPCVRGGAVDREAVEETTKLLTGALTTVRSSVAALPLQRHREVVESVLVVHLGAQARRAMGVARSFASEAERQKRADRAALPTWARAWLWATEAVSALGGQAARAVAFVVALFFSPAAHADGPRTFHWAPRVDDCSNCGKACDGCSQCTDNCNQCGKHCSECGDACNKCGDSCNQCGAGCSRCGDSCNQCGDGCNHCGDGCNQCGNNCNHCGK